MKGSRGPLVKRRYILSKAKNCPTIGVHFQQHKALKHYVANNPTILGLESVAGETEHGLASGDSLDVFFETDALWVAVEVKSSISPVVDIVRGLFQCVKYRAVMDAMLTTERIAKDARVVLVLEGELPRPLVQLKNELRIEVIEGVRPLIR